MHTRLFGMKMIELKSTGFSFIELLVSSVIIFALILGSAQLAFHSMIVKKRSDFRLNTISIIFSQLEELKSHFYSGGEWHEGTFKKTVRVTNSNQFFHLKWNIQSSPMGLKSVELLCWAENFPQKETHLLLYLSDELGF